MEDYVLGLREEVKRMLTLAGEELVIAKREHVFVIIVPIAVSVLSTLVLFVFMLVAFSFYKVPVSLPILSGIVLFIITTSIVTKIVVDWYYHLYLVTSRRIVEITCAPFFSHRINDVFLDQVRITEIDVKIRGILYEFLDMGDVVIFFDRPSHEEAFTLRNIRNPQKAGSILCDKLERIMCENPIWFSPRESVVQRNNKIRNTEDVYRSFTAKKF